MWEGKVRGGDRLWMILCFTDFLLYIKVTYKIYIFRHKYISIKVFEIKTFHLAGFSSGKAEEPLNQNKRFKNYLWVWGSL